jgi:hypothetical protein
MNANKPIAGAWQRAFAVAWWLTVAAGIFADLGIVAVFVVIWIESDAAARSSSERIATLPQSYRSPAEAKAALPQFYATPQEADAAAAKLPMATVLPDGYTPPWYQFPLLALVLVVVAAIPPALFAVIRWVFTGAWRIDWRWS